MLRIIVAIIMLAATVNACTQRPDCPNCVETECKTDLGPDTGSSCVFPFTYKGNTYDSCSEWVWGEGFEGEGKYGFCDCNSSRCGCEYLDDEENYFW